MKRKSFIEKSVLSYLGLILGPTLLASCRKKDLFPDSDFKGKVIIIGAGAAGLAAGFILKSRGLDFTILEASDSTGGRLSQDTDFADYPIDLGAQWLHGKNSIAGDMIKETGTQISKDNSEEFYWFNGQLTSENPLDLDIDQDLPDISIAAYAQQQGFGEEYKYLVEQLAGDYGADSSDLSAKYTSVEEEEWSSGDSDYKFEGTYFDMIDKHITESIRSSISVNTIVTNIAYAGDKVIVTDQNGTDYTGDKVIIAVPIPILQDGDINFQPALPSSKIEAFNKIGMGAGMKVFMKFNSRFYNENIIGGEICAAYADEIIGKSGNDNVLMAFVMGSQAEHLTSLGTNEAITSALLAELDTMYDGQASTSFIASHVENWATKPYIRGAYSYSKIGIGDARSIAAQSVDDKIFFAGEAMNLNGHHQTVHGAIETGYREVINILKS